MEHQRTQLLVLYGSQTGNAQDVAERIGREAALQLYAPRVLPMDAYPVTQLPQEQLVVFVAATAGQGEPPSNMRRTWAFLLRRSLPPTSLAGLSYAVFGLGDSGYVKYNVMAKKLDRRLAGLGATPLLTRGLGDDQHRSGYEAALDPWLTQLWQVLGAAAPLPGGMPRPALTEEALLQLPAPKYVVDILPPGTPPPEAAYTGGPVSSSSATAPTKTAAAANGCSPAAVGSEAGAGRSHPSEQQLQEEAVAAAGAFRALQAAAAGLPSPVAEAPGGPWRPALVPLVSASRVTSPGSPQDTRHLVLDTSATPALGAYQPGDLLCIFPRTPAAAVQAFLARLGWDGDALVRIRLAAATAGAAAAAAAAEAATAASSGGTATQARQQGEGQGGQCTTPEVVAPLRAIVQGVLDIAGASPRRFLFQVLQHFCRAERERERLAYFASAEGRDDLHLYCHRERRSLAEVLDDFPSAAPPLAWLLEAGPLLGPRAFSLASSPGAHPGQAHVLAAVVAWTTPTGRPRKGLVTTWLAGLLPPAPPSAAAGRAAAGGRGDGRGLAVQQQQGDSVQSLGTSVQEQQQQQQQQPGSAGAPLVPVWVERGALRLLPDPTTPLLLIGPGTGVAPFRSFLWQRAALVRQGVAVAPSFLFFGCRSAAWDFYYAEEWRQLQEIGVLDPVQGLITAFSRDPPEQQGDGVHAATFTQQPQQQQQEQQQQQQGTNGVHADAVVPAGGAGDTNSSSGNSNNSSSSRRGGPKVYVTHRLRQHAPLVWDLLSARGAWVYVSGSAEKMPADVAAALADVACQAGGMSAEEGAAYIRQLELKGRYHVEAWS